LKEPVSVTSEIVAEAIENSGVIQVKLTPGASIRPGDLLIHETELDAARTLAGTAIGQLLVRGFGGTCGDIGILIAMATIIGKCLLDSGGAERIVVGIRRAFGERRTSHAFVASGFVMGIPVFADTVFFLLLPLAKAMRMKTGKNYLLYVLCVVGGVTMSHSLVPPTPGPLFVAGELGVDVGLMMLGGLLVGAPCATVGYFYAKWADRKWDIPLRSSAELTQEQLEAMVDRDESSLPPLFVSLLPIVLPVVLIAGGTALRMLELDAPGLDVWSDKNIALVFSAAVALSLLAHRVGRSAMGPAVGSALASGGVIILITAAGGAFGQALRQTGIAYTIADLVPASSMSLLWLPVAFGITMLVRIAQGSATVAMITSVGIVAPIAASTDLGFHPLYLALAIGCGSKPIPWMNDSGFWAIAKMAGFTESETLKTVSAMMSTMGFVGIIITTVVAWVFPLT
jgi:GntP family gluconate:H+ symporter